jgi:4'-phosphopantetheinyl transferase
MSEMEGIAESFFSGRELAWLRGVSAADREMAFFRCWVRKEACLKALGTGLSGALDTLDVCLKPSEAAQVIHADKTGQGEKTLTFWELPMGPEYMAALAVEGHVAAPCCWDWKGSV